MAAAAAAVQTGLGHEQDSRDGSPGRSVGSTRPSSEVLQPSSSGAGQFDIEMVARGNGSSLTLQLRRLGGGDISGKVKCPGRPSLISETLKAFSKELEQGDSAGVRRGVELGF